MRRYMPVASISACGRVCAPKLPATCAGRRTADGAGALRCSSENVRRGRLGHPQRPGPRRDGTGALRRATRGSRCSLNSKCAHSRWAPPVSHCGRTSCQIGWGLRPRARSRPRRRPRRAVVGGVSGRTTSSRVLAPKRPCSARLGRPTGDRSRRPPLRPGSFCPGARHGGSPGGRGHRPGGRAP